MTKIKGLAEIVLNVHDTNLDKTVAFYKETLGLEEIARPGPIFLKAGNPAINIPQLLVLMPLPPTSAFFMRPRPLHHLAFEIAAEDFEGEEQRLKGLGYELRYGEHPVFNVRTLYLDDPEGNEVELICGT